MAAEAEAAQRAKEEAAAAAAAAEAERRTKQREAIATPGRTPQRRMTTPRRQIGL
jgi:hypothetical protein